MAQRILSIVRGSIVVGLAALLASCGGGGSGGSASTPTVAVSLFPPSVSLTYVAEGQSLNAPTVQITATVSGLGAPTVYATLVADAPVLNGSSVAVTLRPDGSLAATLPFSTTLPAGTYTGTLTLHLCTDAACTSQLTVSGGNLPYTLTVTPAIHVAASVNGVPRSSPLQLRSGDVLQLQSSEPVGWSESQGGVIVSNRATTATTWSGTLGYGLSTPGGVGTLQVNALRQQAPQAQQSTNVSVTQ